MGCIIVVLAWLSPRLVIALLWGFTERMTIAFNSGGWPLSASCSCRTPRSCGRWPTRPSRGSPVRVGRRSSGLIATLARTPAVAARQRPSRLTPITSWTTGARLHVITVTRDDQVDCGRPVLARPPSVRPAGPRRAAPTRRPIREVGGHGQPTRTGPRGDEIVAGLRAAADPDRAEHERAYLKSDREHWGVSVPAVRRVARAFAWAHPDLTAPDLRALVAALWSGPCTSGAWSPSSCSTPPATCSSPPTSPWWSASCASRAPGRWSTVSPPRWRADCRAVPGVRRRARPLGGRSRRVGAAGRAARAAGAPAPGRGRLRPLRPLRRRPPRRAGVLGGQGHRLGPAGHVAAAPGAGGRLAAAPRRSGGARHVREAVKYLPNAQRDRIRADPAVTPAVTVRHAQPADTGPRRGVQRSLHPGAGTKRGSASYSEDGAGHNWEGRMRRRSRGGARHA